MDPIELRLQRDPGCEDIPLPAYASEGSSGMDIRAALTEPMTLHPGDIRLIPTGLRMAVPVGYEIQVRPRSGLSLKHGITVVNTPGTIDADYRGPVGIILGNVSREPFTIERSDRIAQLVVQQVVHPAVKLVPVLEDTERGEGGFGSSGIQ